MFIQSSILDFLSSVLDFPRYTIATMSEKGVGAGHKFEPYAVTWLQRDVLLFANSIGATVDELQFIYVCSCQESITR